MVSLVVLLGCPGGPEATKAGAEAEAAGVASAGSNAAGGEPAAVAAITACPRSLGGSEKQHRVISKDCGVVEVTEDLNVEGGSLTLEAGASLAFKDGAGLNVGGSEPAKLIVQGTAEEPVVFTSAGDKVAGAWKGVALHERSSRSSVKGLVIEFAGAGEEAALRVHGQDITVEGSTIRASKAGVVVAGDGGFAAFTNNELKKLGQPAAIVVAAAAVGGLGVGNRFDAAGYVLVQGGSVRRSAKWQRVGAPLVIAEDVAVDGDKGQRTTLELAAGLELRFTESAIFNVGYYESAALVARGAAEAPVTLTAQVKREPGGWRGVRVHAQGEATFEHAVLEFGGGNDDGVIDLRSGTLTLRSTTLRSDKLGVVADAESKISAFVDNKFVATPIAVQVPARLIGSLGDGNAYDKDAKLQAQSDAIKGKATWGVQGAPIELVGELLVDGELTLDAGLALLAGTDAEIKVGFYEPATLLVRGTGAAPVTIGPADTIKGRWPGVVLYERSAGNSLEHLVLTGAGNANAIEAKARTNATLSSVTCSKCAGAVVGWECGATVTSSQVLAADGTPQVEARPSGC